MDRDIDAEIRKLIAENRVVIFMKGDRQSPMCGFSATAVRVFEALEVPFHTVDVLPDPELREVIKSFANWPTIPQVYIGGQFVGGSDIVKEMYERGELDDLVAGIEPSH